VPPQFLRERNGIISCGKKAAQWVQFHVSGDVPVLEIKTPQYFLIRDTEPEIAAVYESVRDFVENYI
ncbi:MAG: hypothetical protein ACXABY_00940, partial [Candidatus Thorarchaeota archaeon]